ncbi:polysaccharide deacetylase family protein [Streptomonospora salina]|uniref:Peptidoglycan/xylan/chitin deacetylase (PgdA/CDA1 family) n=1 Tax=Streptomonospora salina TaxID=104205 RepID=A0A841EM84_9ACTN|nr:polysaccharide deacetylase family protein [Streptomonospora salina]MBB6000531.1 peptidoglycan/xylan/chitin deacetylase (PgdA/CDA1 family) [Streptomonospora salina]
MVGADHIPGLREQTTTDSVDGVDVELSYPQIPNAEPFAERIAALAEQEAHDFAGSVPGAESYTVDWQISVAGGNVLAVRLTQREKDGDGERTGRSTYWYNTESGRTAYSTELLDGQSRLEELDTLVKERIADREGVDAARLYPIAELYDSIGFNPDGDLVVEFDEGQVAPADQGSVHAVVPEKQADPLLSPFGERAQEAAVVVTPEFEITSAASAPKDGEDPGNVPGMLSTAPDDVDCQSSEAKCIALTFDDGPGGRTPEVLDALADYDARATFFVTGGPVREHPGTVRRTYAEGHELANHTVHHPDLTSLGEGGVAGELTTVNRLVRRETGFSMELMRPPYGATDDGVADVAADMEQAQVLWSIDTNDWRDHDAGIVTDRAVERARPGAIVLMHDIHDTTVDAVPRILKRLDGKGYTMVTVSQLLGATDPGGTYTDADPSHPPPTTEPSP